MDVWIDVLGGDVCSSMYNSTMSIACTPMLERICNASASVVARHSE